MMSKTVYDPLGLFEQNENKGGICALKSAVGQYASGTTDGALVSAVTGKIILVLAAMFTNKGAATTAVALRSKPAGAGALISPRFEIVADSNLVIPATQFGYFQTVSGEALTVENNGDIVDVFVRYIEVVP